MQSNNCNEWSHPIEEYRFRAVLHWWFGSSNFPLGGWLVGSMYSVTQCCAFTVSTHIVPKGILGNGISEKTKTLIVLRSSLAPLGVQTLAYRGQKSLLGYYITTTYFTVHAENPCIFICSVCTI